jgi:hypothetical protein
MQGELFTESIITSEVTAMNRRLLLSPQCGLQVIDLNGGDVAHWLRLQGDVSELYDVGALPGVTRPMALGRCRDRN